MRPNSPLQLLLPVGGDTWSGDSNSYRMKMILLGSDLEYSKHRMLNNLIFKAKIVSFKTFGGGWLVRGDLVRVDKKRISCYVTTYGRQYGHQQSD